MLKMHRAAYILDKIAEWSLYILIFTLPFSKSIIEITIVTALLSVIIKKIILKEQFFTASYINILLYVFLALSFISLLNTSYIGLSSRAFFSKSLKFAALFLITKEIINTREKLNNFVTMALLSCVIILIDGFIQYFVTHIDLLHDYPAFKFVGDDPSFLGAPTASFPYPNDFSAWILIFIFPIGIFFFLGCAVRWPGRIALGLIFSSLLYSLILARVRGAWLSFLIALGVVSLFKLKKIIMLLLMILLVCASLARESVVPYILSFVSINDRQVMWSNGCEIFKKHPIIGNGLNTFYRNYTKIRNDEYKDKKGSYAHNCYLQMAAEIGLLGLASFLAFIVAIFIKAFKSLRMIRDPLYYSLILGISSGLTAYLMHSFVDTNLYSLNLAALFWISSGLLLAIVKIAESGV